MTGRLLGRYRGHGGLHRLHFQPGCFGQQTIARCRVYLGILGVRA